VCHDDSQLSLECLRCREANVNRVEARIDYPNTPIPAYMSVVDTDTNERYEMFLGYRPSRQQEVAHVKVYKNGNPVEYVTASIGATELVFEVIDEAEKYHEIRTDFAFPARGPVDLSRGSRQQAARKLESARRRFPPLPNLRHFGDEAPSSLVVGKDGSFELATATGRTSRFDPQELVRVGSGEPGDLIIGACLAGPVACGVAVGIAVFLWSSSAE
jgi:hypothetical protein